MEAKRGEAVTVRGDPRLTSVGRGGRNARLCRTPRERAVQPLAEFLEEMDLGRVGVWSAAFDVLSIPTVILFAEGEAKETLVVTPQ